MQSAVLNHQSAADTEEVVLIAVSKIRRFEAQPREYFDPREIEARAESIKKVGQEEPITVRRLNPPEDGIEYELISGEMRWRALQLAKIAFARAIVKKVRDPLHQFEMALTANGSTPMTPHENAKAVWYLESQGRTVPEIAAAFGRDETFVRNHLKLKDLHPKVFERLSPAVPRAHQLTMQMALLLAEVPTKSEQIGFMEVITTTGASYVKAKHLIKDAMAVRGVRTRKKGDDFILIRNQFQRMRDATTLFIQQPTVRIRAALKGRSNSDLRALVEIVEELEGDLAAIRETIEQHIVIKK